MTTGMEKKRRRRRRPTAKAQYKRVRLALSDLNIFLASSDRVKEVPLFSSPSKQKR